MTWIIGAVAAPNIEYQIIRYESLERASINLASLMAQAGPYSMGELLSCIQFIQELDNTTAEEFNEPGKELMHLQLFDIMFVIGKYDALSAEDGAPYRIIQDHRECSPEHCFGDIAERN